MNRPDVEAFFRQIEECESGQEIYDYILYLERVVATIRAAIGDDTIKSGG